MRGRGARPVRVGGGGGKGWWWRAAGRGRQSGMREEAAARHGAWQHVRRRRGCPPNHRHRARRHSRRVSSFLTAKGRRRDAFVERGGAEAWPGRAERGGRNPSRLFKALDCTKGFPEEHGRQLAGVWG